MKNLVFNSFFSFGILSLFIFLFACSSSSDDPAPAPLTAPVATAATDITNSLFMANWNNSTGATGYDLDVASDNGFSTIVESKTNLGGSTVIDQLNDNTEYFYRVRAKASGSTTSANSNIISVFTLPDAPVATAATGITQNSFTANWDAVDGITTYKLYVSESTPPAAPFVTGFDGLEVTGTSQEVTGLTNNTVYYYVLEATSDGRVSEVSNTITAPTDI